MLASATNCFHHPKTTGNPDLLDSQILASKFPQICPSENEFRLKPAKDRGNKNTIVILRETNRHSICCAKAKYQKYRPSFDPHIAKSNKSSASPFRSRPRCRKVRSTKDTSKPKGKKELGRRNIPDTVLTSLLRVKGSGLGARMEGSASLLMSLFRVLGLCSAVRLERAATLLTLVDTLTFASEGEGGGGRVEHFWGGSTVARAGGRPKSM